MIRRLTSDTAPKAFLDTTDDVSTQRSERDLETLPPIPRNQERQHSYVKAEVITVKEEKDITASNIRLYPKSSMPRPQDARIESSIGSYRTASKPRVNSNEVMGGEPALRDKTNGNKLHSSIAENKLSKRRLPSEVTDALYKRRRAPDSTFRRS